MLKKTLIAGGLAAGTLASVAFAMSTFQDVPADHWAASAISWANETGIMTGPGETPGMFNPGGEVNRAQLATVSERLYKQIMKDVEAKMAEGSSTEELSYPEGEEPDMEKFFPYDIVMTNVSTFEDADGSGSYGMLDGETRLYTNFNIPDPDENYSYEGWLICDDQVYSTGMLEKNEGLYENFFVSTDIAENCQEYVLTLEEGELDETPGEHLFEGKMEAVSDMDPSMDWNEERFETMAGISS